MFRNVCIFCLLWFIPYSVSNIVKRSPYCKGNICKFRWVVDYKFTMMWYNRTSPELEYQPIIQDSKGFIRRRSTTPNCSEIHTAVTLTEFEDVVSFGDGDYRMVYAINGQIPGPEIIVTEGDMISVRVFNRLKVEGLTIHWHGLLHRGTPWMDGASMISQCPILPGQVFEYRFLAEPVGTHWYHAHTNTMRNDGLSGALIVLPKQSAVPQYYGDFFAVVQDWTKRSAAETAEAYRGRLFGFEIPRTFWLTVAEGSKPLIQFQTLLLRLEDYDGTCTPAERMPDGTVSVFSLNVGLVNGRGRRYINNDFVTGEKPFIPMEIFTVEPNQWYRFRIINAGFAQPFQVSFEAHTIYVVALDGNDVLKQKWDTVVISPGESVDIKIETNRSPNNYYINFKTLPTTTESGPIQKLKMTRAILNYQGVSRHKIAVNVPRQCTQNNPCYVINQLYGRSADPNIINIPLTDIHSTAQSISRNPVPTNSPGSKHQEFFLNFHIFHVIRRLLNSKNITIILLYAGGQPAINGRRFLYPTSALQTHRSKRGTTPCAPPYCSQDRCRCTHTLKLEIDNVIQFVFFTQGLKAAHPIHFHGHQFHVVKVAYPEYDFLTGNATTPNSDIKCLNDDYTEATWADPNWHYEVPGLNLKDPPIKDTVNIPWGGYVVVRIKADNPGYWLLHCHLGHHQSQGMSLVLQEGDPANMVEIPTDFPTCHSFLTSQQKIKDAIDNQKKLLEEIRIGGSKSSQDESSQSKGKTLKDFFKGGEEIVKEGFKNAKSQTKRRKVDDFVKKRRKVDDFVKLEQTIRPVLNIENSEKTSEGIFPLDNMDTSEELLSSRDTKPTDDMSMNRNTRTSSDIDIGENTETYGDVNSGSHDGSIHINLPDGAVNDDSSTSNSQPIIQRPHVYTNEFSSSDGNQDAFSPTGTGFVNPFSQGANTLPYISSMYGFQDPFYSQPILPIDYSIDYASLSSSSFSWPAEDPMPHDANTLSDQDPLYGGPILPFDYSIDYASLSSSSSLPTEDSIPHDANTLSETTGVLGPDSNLFAGTDDANTLESDSHLSLRSTENDPNPTISSPTGNSVGDSVSVESNNPPSIESTDSNETAPSGIPLLPTDLDSWLLSPPISSDASIDSRPVSVFFEDRNDAIDILPQKGVLPKSPFGPFHSNPTRETSNDDTDPFASFSSFVQNNPPNI